MRRGDFGQRGQTLIIVAVVISLMIAMGGFAVDMSRNYQQRRDLQSAADAAVLSGGFVLENTSDLTQPIATDSGAIRLGWSQVNQNLCGSAMVCAGSPPYVTQYTTACQTLAADKSYVRATFTDLGTDSASCASTTPSTASPSGYHARLIIQSPACFNGDANVECSGEDLSGTPDPPSACARGKSTQFECLQVVIQATQTHFLAGYFGVPSALIKVAATVFGSPGVSGSANLPPANALYLYQPQVSCTGECYNETLVPSGGTNPTRNYLGINSNAAGCSSAAACTSNTPTFWVSSQPGSTAPMIVGADGTKSAVPADYPAVQSNGDMVIQDPTTICDSYNGATCVSGQKQANASLRGWTLNNILAGSKVFCNALVDSSGTHNPVTPATLTAPCTNANPPGGLDHLFGNRATFSTQTWAPTVDTSKLPACGGVILNGDTVANSTWTGTQCLPANDAECVNGPTSCPYTLVPGRYDYIVVNEGVYEFRSGIYDITGMAPVNSNTTNWGTGPTHTRANGIDHSGETGASDAFDLCKPLPATKELGCNGVGTNGPLLTAGVWIGQGTGGSADYSSGSATCGANGTTTDAGGGPQTVVNGSGVTFLLEGANERHAAGSGGFVVTAEATANLSAPPTGTSNDVGGVPLLIADENSSFVHLDGQATTITGLPTQTSGYTGIVYQAKADGTALSGGGVEINPHLDAGAAKGTAALSGQVIARTFATFGAKAPDPTDPTIGFASAFNSGSAPVASTGKEPSVIGAPTITAVQGSSPLVYAMQIPYKDEWPLDAADVWVRVNNGAKLFWYQAGQVYPATIPSAPAASPISPYVTPTGNLAPVLGGENDWERPLDSGGNPDTAPYLEINGAWWFGHAQGAAGFTGKAGTYSATIQYVFQPPANGGIQVTLFLTDGDHCGDTAQATWTVVGTSGQIRLIQ